MNRNRCWHVLAFGALLGTLISSSGCLLVKPLDDPSPSLQTGGRSGNSGASSGAQAGIATSSGGAGTGACSSNAECSRAHNDDPYFCRSSDGECVALATSTCPLVYGDWNAPNAIFFGAFAEINPTELGDSPNVYAYQLALEEFNRSGGLPGPGNTRFPLVMTVCQNDSQIDRSMQHLADELGVPAILAALMPADLLAVFEKYNRIFFLNPYGGNRALRALEDSGLVWSLLGSPGDFAGIYAALLERAESFVRGSRGIVASDPIRVASFGTLDDFSTELADGAIETLRFNDAGLASNLQAGNYLGRTLDASTADQTEIEALGRELVEFSPHIVISFAGHPFAGKPSILRQIESGLWSSGERPTYLLSPVNHGSLDVDDLAGIIRGQISNGVDPGANRRFLGVGPAFPADTSLRNAYLVRLHQRFERARGETDQFYDAFYFLAYAIYGADLGSLSTLSGSDVARGMKRLVDGTTSYDVGPNGLTDVYAALNVRGSTLALRGTLGPPDFDVASGMRIESGSVFCYDSMARLKNNALRFDRTATELVGEFGCFDGF